MSSKAGCRRSLVSYLGLGLMIVALGLGACANRSGAPVREQGKPLRQPEAEYREVVAGDTLYSIAWESGRDYRELAAWNGIAPPYTIKPGQRIRLHPTAAVATKTAGPISHAVQKGETLFGIAARYDVAVADLAVWNGLAAPYTIKPGQILRVVAPGEIAAKKDTKRADKKPAHKTETPPDVVANRATVPPSNIKTAASFGAWMWPAEGNLLARWNTGGASKGIDIGGKAGQPIVAAAPGTVVYQGSGLRGYGQLIIIKHNADFLSAYAHCDKIVVREGNVIKRGQKIAEMGNTGTDRVKLHFEIRHRGTPVDPLYFLPKK